jgi:quinoprotein glucose dehydrogenase
MRHSSNWAVWPAIVSAVLALASGADSMLAQGGLEEGQWREYAGDTRGLKYSPLDRINKNNIKDLEVAWRWASADRDYQIANPTMRSTRHEDTPLMVNGTLYTVTPLGMVAALDPGTGQQRWLYDPEVYKAGKPGNSGFIHRGLAYWTDGKVERLLHGTNDAYVYSLDARSGKLDPAFGTGGRVDLTEVVPRAVRSTNFMGRRPLIAGDVVVVGNAILDPTRTKEMPPGYVQAFDVRSGKRLWIFHTVPKPGEFGYDTWLNGSAE